MGRGWRVHLREEGDEIERVERKRWKGKKKEFVRDSKGVWEFVEEEEEDGIECEFEIRVCFEDVCVEKKERWEEEGEGERPVIGNV